MERILCEKPKTFYNVVSGEKIADGVAAYVGFANGWYSCVLQTGVPVCMTAAGGLQPKILMRLRRQRMRICCEKGKFLRFCGRRQKADAHGRGN